MTTKVTLKTEFSARKAIDRYLKHSKDTPPETLPVSLRRKIHPDHKGGGVDRPSDMPEELREEIERDAQVFGNGFAEYDPKTDTWRRLDPRHVVITSFRPVLSKSEELEYADIVAGEIYYLKTRSRYNGE